MYSVFKHNLAYDVCMSLIVYYQNSWQVLQIQIKDYAKIMPICNCEKQVLNFDDMK